MHISLEQPAHAGAIEALLDSSFGAKRHTKTVYRLREGVDPVPELGFVVLDGDADGTERVVATIRYWPILIGGTVPALLLGPIAVAPELRSLGLGGKLIRHSLERAAELGHRIVLLVGDAPYYTRFGFTRAVTLNLSLPGPVDMDRFLGLELVAGALDGVSGLVDRDASAPPLAAEMAEAADPEPIRVATDGTPPRISWHYEDMGSAFTAEASAAAAAASSSSPSLPLASIWTASARRSRRRAAR